MHRELLLDVNLARLSCLAEQLGKIVKSRLKSPSFPRLSLHAGDKGADAMQGRVARTSVQHCLFIRGYCLSGTTNPGQSK